MATVYLAQDLKHERPVALKVLDPDLSVSLGAERFLREIKLIARLQHPHILPLLTSGEADGLFYYAMPFVLGDSLRDLPAREGPLLLADAVRFALEVADALAYAHRHGSYGTGTSNRRTSSGNDAGVGADFGIARAISASTASP